MFEFKSVAHHFSDDDDGGATGMGILHADGNILHGAGDDLLRFEAGILNDGYRQLGFSCPSENIGDIGNFGQAHQDLSLIHI